MKLFWSHVDSTWSCGCLDQIQTLQDHVPCFSLFFEYTLQKLTAGTKKITTIEKENHLKHPSKPPFWGSISSSSVVLLGGGNSNIFYFHPETLGRWSKLTSILFKWVGKKPPTSIQLFFAMAWLLSIQNTQLLRFKSCKTFLEYIRWIPIGLTVDLNVQQQQLVVLKWGLFTTLDWLI